MTFSQDFWRLLHYLCSLRCQSFQQPFSAECWAEPEPDLHSRLYWSFTFLSPSATTCSYPIKPFLSNHCNYFGKDWAVGSAAACLGQEVYEPNAACLHASHPLLRAPFQTLWTPSQHCANHSTRHTLPASNQQHPSGPTQPLVREHE